MFAIFEILNLIFSATQMFQDEGYECEPAMNMHRKEWDRRWLCTGSCYNCRPDSNGREEILDEALAIWRSI